MRRLQMLVLATALALAASACGREVVPDAAPTATGSPLEQPADGAGGDASANGADDGSADGTGTDDGGQAEPENGTADGGGTAEDAGADGGDAAGDDDGTSGTDGGQQPSLAPLADDGPVGANAAAYLRGDRPRVVLEIDTQEGASLPDGVVAHVRDVLARESNATVEVQTGAATGTRQDAWTADQLRTAADETRTVAHGDDTAVLHLLVLRDRYEDDGVLGLAFGSSSAVVFPDQWSDLTTALLSGDRIARAVTTHEVGHLLGLVGLHQEPTSDHEDPEHPGHTTDRNDVMHYAVERDVISQLDGIPTDFGELTRADLAAIREG